MSAGSNQVFSNDVNLYSGQYQYFTSIFTPITGFSAFTNQSSIINYIISGDIVECWGFFDKATFVNTGCSATITLPIPSSAILGTGNCFGTAVADQGFGYVTGNGDYITASITFPQIGGIPQAGFSSVWVNFNYSLT